MLYFDGSGLPSLPFPSIRTAYSPQLTPGNVVFEMEALARPLASVSPSAALMVVASGGSGSILRVASASGFPLCRTTAVKDVMATRESRTPSSQP